ncbi:hypothetical protein V6N13_015145 [Hibiscus sabdariffa]
MVLQWGQAQWSVKLRDGNLVVGDEMTETRFRNGGNNDVIHIPNEAMVVDEQHGIPISVGFLGQSDRITGSKDSLKPLFCDMLTGGLWPESNG